MAFVLFRLPDQGVLVFTLRLPLKRRAVACGSFGLRPFRAGAWVAQSA